MLEKSPDSGLLLLLWFEEVEFEFLDRPKIWLSCSASPPESCIEISCAFCSEVAVGEFWGEDEAGTVEAEVGAGVSEVGLVSVLLVVLFLLPIYKVVWTGGMSYHLDRCVSTNFENLVKKFS